MLFFPRGPIARCKDNVELLHSPEKCQLVLALLRQATVSVSPVALRCQMRYVSAHCRARLTHDRRMKRLSATLARLYVLAASLLVPKVHAITGCDFDGDHCAWSMKGCDQGGGGPACHVVSGWEVAQDQDADMLPGVDHSNGTEHGTSSVFSIL